MHYILIHKLGKVSKRNRLGFVKLYKKNDALNVLSEKVNFNSF